MSTDTNISTLVLNKLTKEQYANIASPNNQELYFITNDDTFIASDQGSNNAGKVLTVGNDGIVIPVNAPSGLPDQTGNDGKYLTTNGTNASWVNLSNVASTGDYNDLINKPYIPSGVVVDQTYDPNSTNAASGIAVAEALGTLSNVASTGEYDDLLNKPTIPAAQVNSDWNATSGVAEILNKPTLSNVALSGEYNDLLNTPSLANVATTGEYSDLLNTPSIPSPQVNSDWNSTSGVSEILNKPTLSTVATTGDYNDLINKPTIPSNFANVAFTGDYNDLINTPVLGTAAYANTSDFATAAQGIKADNAETHIGTMSNLTTMDKTSLVGAINEVAVGAAAGATAVQPGDLANVATTGEYSDLLNTPTIPAAQVNADWNAVSGVAQILNKPTLANIATTGEYSDLVNAPSLANVATTGEYSDLLNTPTIPNVPVVVQDFYVNGTTGAIDCTFSATPTTKTVHTIIGNIVINGTWSGNVFTPNTADDILNNANGFIVSVF